MKHVSSIEPLEPRIAPAVLVNPTTLHYIDKDGDHVTIQLSKPLLTSLASAQAVFNFNTGSVVQGPASDSTPQQLELINLDSLAATGLGLKVTVQRANHGDGYAAVGYIESSADLGAISIEGDLGGISAGDATATTPGLKSLTVLSLGEYGVFTQGTNVQNFTPTLVSTIKGALTTLKVKTDAVGIDLSAEGFGAITIGGSLAGTGQNASGIILSAGNAGAIRIGQSIEGGAATESGSIQVTGKIASLSVGHSITGALGGGGPGSESESGYVSAGSLGPVKIGGELIAGSYLDSGEIFSDGAIASITIAGSVVGGAGSTTDGQIDAAGAVGAIKIGGSLLGGSGAQSGSIDIGGNLGAVGIAGSIQGGTENGSGTISARGNLASVTVGGSLVGDGSGDPNGNGGAGEIVAGMALGAVKIQGSIVGGAASDSGAVIGHSIASVTVGGSMIGGSNTKTGAIEATTLGPVSIKENLTGGSGNESGAILADGSAAAVTIGGSISGGSGTQTGVVYSEGSLPSVTVDGSLNSGSGAESGIYADGSLGTILIKGNVGGTTAEHAFIGAVGLPPGGAPAKTDVAIKSLIILGNVVHGDIVGGSEPNHSDSGHEDADAQIGSVKIGGNFIGSDIVAGVSAGARGFGSGATAIAGGSATIKSAIGNIAIGGQVFGGTSSDNTGTIYGIVAQQIGSIKVGATSLPLTTGADNDLIPLPVGITGSFFYYEV